MAQNYSLGSFGYNVIPKNAYAPVTVENAPLKEHSENIQAKKNLFDNMEYILSGVPTEENNIITRQMMLVGMGMKSQEANDGGQLNIMM